MNILIILAYQLNKASRGMKFCVNVVLNYFFHKIHYEVV